MIDAIDNEIESRMLAAIKIDVIKLNFIGITSCLW